MPVLSDKYRQIHLVFRSSSIQIIPPHQQTNRNWHDLDYNYLVPSMKKKKHIFSKMILAFLLLPAAVYADDGTASPSPTPEVSAPSAPESLDSRIKKIVSYYGLGEGSLSVAYNNMTTGEYYGYNEKTYMFAASTYKLPLNMYYYMMENSGEIDPHADVGGYDLSDAHYLSIVNSDNSASEAMMNALGSYRHYKDLMFQTFGDSYYSANIDPVVYEDNDYPAGFLMNVLQYLYNHQEDFQEMLSYMSSPDQINAVDNTLRSQVTVYQKQGWYNEVNTVTEIVMAEQPYLAVIMVDDYSYQGPSVLSDVNTAIYEYTQEYTEYSKQVTAYVEQNLLKNQQIENEKKNKFFLDPAFLQDSSVQHIVLTAAGIILLIGIASLIVKIKN